jgi:AraC-like DNA-binding protein
MACGYASTSHFSKSFRKKYGVSPYRFSHFGGDGGQEE